MKLNSLKPMFILLAHVSAATLSCASFATLAFGAEYRCTGKAHDENGEWAAASFNLAIAHDGATLVETSLGGTYGFTLTGSFDPGFTPRVYKDYYRYLAPKQTQEGWDRVLVAKSMADQDSSVGQVVVQGTVEDGGNAAHFNCVRRK